MDLGVGTGVSSCGGLGTVGRSEVVDADRVRLIDALRSRFGTFPFFLSRRAGDLLIAISLPVDASVNGTWRRLR